MSTPRTDANIVRGFEALRITKDEEEWVRAGVAIKLETELQSAEAKLAEMAEALEFYATPGNWENDTAEAHGAPVSVPYTAAIFGDLGGRAIGALSDLPERAQRLRELVEVALELDDDSEFDTGKHDELMEKLHTKARAYQGDSDA